MDPRSEAPGLLRRVLASLPRGVRRVAPRADAGYFATYPSGYIEVNTAWMWGALLATSIAGWLHQLLANSPTTNDDDHPEDPNAYPAIPERPAGLGVRNGKTMIATLRHCLLCIPGRLIHHAGQLILRLPPGHRLLATALARLRTLPQPS